MGRTIVRYSRQRDPAEEARNKTVDQFKIQRQAQASAYAAARFQEWQANSQVREQNLQLRNQILQSQAEMAGLKTQKDLYNQGEIDRETKMYLAGMPALREQLKNANIKPGSDEYRAEISAFAQHIPHAFASNPDIRQDLRELSHVDATAAEISDKIKTFQQGFKQATGQAPGEVHVSKEGEISGQGRAGTRDAEEDLFKSHKITPTQFLNVPPTSIKRGNLDDAGKFTEDATGGSMLRFPAGVTDTGASRTVQMPVQEFYARKKAFSQQQQAPQTAQAVTQPNASISSPAQQVTPESIRQRFRSGDITREDAAKQLTDLGFE